MFMKKKYLALVLAASMVMSTLAACGGSGSNTQEPAASEAESTADASEEATPEESVEESEEAEGGEAASSAHGPGSI